MSTLHSSHPTPAALIVETYWSEHDHQVRPVDWCRYDSPPPLRLRAAQIYAIPNGGHRHPAVAARLKAEGVTPGMPDLHLPIATGREHGLSIEMKKIGGRPDPEQVRKLAELRRNGYRAVFAGGWREAVAITTDYLEQA